MRSFFLLVILAIIPGIAGAGLFDILQEQYIADISELPYSPGNPSVSWQESGNIKGWIDITGFRNLSRDGEKYHILGDPSSLAIVAGDATGNPPGIFDSLDKSISLTQSGNNLIASLHVVLKWHTIYCDDKGCFINGRFTDTATFQDIEVIPDQFDNILSPRVNITEYNNTIEPKISISITGINSSCISFIYGNKSLTHSSKSYHVEKTEKGIYYANASDLDAWKIKGQGIARLSDSVIINTNLSSLDYSHLDIRISNLYGSVKVDPSQFNISRVTYQPETVVYNPVLYGFLGIFATLTGATFYLFNRAIV
jgi:hypothetical protein